MNKRLINVIGMIASVSVIALSVFLIYYTDFNYNYLLFELLGVVFGTLGLIKFIGHTLL